MKVVSAVFATVFLISSFSGSFLESVVAVESRVAGIEIERLMNLDKLDTCLHEWRDRMKDLQKTLEVSEAKLKEGEEKLRKLYDELKELEKSKLASEETKKTKMEEFMKLQNEYQTNVSYITEFRNKSLQLVQGEVLEKIKRVSRELGKKQGWDQINMGGVLYLSDRTNLTQVVRKALDTEYDTAQAKAKEATKAEETKQAAKK